MTFYPTDLHPPVERANLPLDALAALQIGLGELIAALPIVSIDLVEWVSRGRVESRRVSIARVSFDAPKPTDEPVIPSVVIRPEGDVTYDMPEIGGPSWDEDDVPGFRGALRRIGAARVTLLVAAQFAAKEDRGGFRFALEQALLVEPRRDRLGRIVPLAHYFNAPARFNLRGFSQADDGADARSGEFLVTATVDAEVDVLALAPRPAPLHPSTTVVARE